MSTENPNVNTNDLKIRLLQLKGLGYDKLLKKEDLTNQLIVIGNELVAIAGEVEALTKIIVEAEGSAVEGAPGQELGPTPPPPQPVVPPQNGNKLPPAPPASTKTVAKKTKTTPKKEKVKKTSHTIGRRA